METPEKKAKEIINRYEQIWMGLDNVTGIAAGRTQEGRICIMISMETDDPATKEIFPVELEGVPVKFRISGRIEPLN